MSDASQNRQGLQSDFWLNFKRSRNAVVGNVIVTIVVLIAIFGPSVGAIQLHEHGYVFHVG